MDNKGQSSTSVLLLALVVVILASFILITTGLFTQSGGNSPQATLEYTQLEGDFTRIEWVSGIGPESIIIESSGNGSFINTRNKANLSALGDDTVYSGSEGDVLTIWAKFKNGDKELIRKKEIGE